jgi:hypothetical protein
MFGLVSLHVPPENFVLVVMMVVVLCVQELRRGPRSSGLFHRTCAEQSEIIMVM